MLRTVALFNVTLGIPFEPMVILTGYATRDPESKNLYYAHGMTFFALSVATILLLRLTKVRPPATKWIVLACHVSFLMIVADLAARAYGALEGRQSSLNGMLTVEVKRLPTLLDLHDLTNSCSMLPLLSATFIIISPFKFSRTLIHAGIFFACCFYAFHETHSTWMAGSLAAVIAGIIMRGAIETLGFVSVRATYLQEVATRKAAEARFERELELARGIQTSLSAPPSIDIGSFRVRTSTLPHQLVGGDWVGVRQISADEAVVVVADAAGKGMQAALIVHAVQSLWALSDTASFDARVWMGQVNKALCELGKGQLHTMTMAVLHLRPNQLILWNAGHCPVLWLDRTRLEDNYLEVFSPGNILGMHPTLNLQPKVIGGVDLDHFRAVLCTDGVLDQLPRNKKKRATFIQKLEGDLGGAMSELKASDDQTLVVIESLQAATSRAS